MATTQDDCRSLHEIHSADDGIDGCVWAQIEPYYGIGDECGNFSAAPAPGECVATRRVGESCIGTACGDPKLGMFYRPYNGPDRPMRVSSDGTSTPLPLYDIFSTTETCGFQPVAFELCDAVNAPEACACACSVGSSPPAPNPPMPNLPMPNPPVGSPIWLPTSVGIEGSWSAFFDGGFRLELTRDEMTPEQLEALGRVVTIPSNDLCFADGAFISIIVLDTNGSSNTYFAEESDGTCNRGEPSVSFEPADQVLQSAGCLAGKQYSDRLASLGTTLSLPVGTGCWHGLFNASGESPVWWFFFEVSEAGQTLEFTIEECADRQLSLAVYDERGEGRIAEQVGSGVEDDCPVLLHTFPEAGTYSLQVDMLGGNVAGDFFLSAEPYRTRM